VLAAFVVLIGMRLLGAAWLLHGHTERDDNILGGDARRYDEISNGQGTPYRDFEVEYPPVTLALVEATHGFDQASTLEKLIVSEVILDLATVGVLAWAWDRRTALAYLVLSAPMILFPFLYVRIDLLSVFLATLGLGLVRRGLQRSGGTAMAVSIYAKVWPAVLLPVLLIERRTKATVAWVISLVVGGAAWVFWAGTSGPQQVLSFRGSKGWQIESMVGIWYHWSNPLASRVEGGAWRTAAAIPSYGRPLLTALSGITVLLAWWLAWRRRRDGDDDSVVYGLAPLVCVLGLLIFAPILSPQYILWLLPSAAIVAARRNWVMAGLTVAVTALTTIVFATILTQVEGQFWSMVPLVTRNGLLIVMLIVGFVQLWRPVHGAPGEPAGGADQTAHDRAGADPEPATTSPSA
jgi:hypothetical protein